MKLDDMKLTKEDFTQKTSWLIEDFIPKNMITSYYSGGGVGKTWLSYAITKHILDNNEGVKFYYFDFDNSMTTLVDRKADVLLVDRYDLNLLYLQRSKLNMMPIEILNRMEYAKESYSGSVILIDSLRNIVNIKNDRASMTVMDKLMNLRDAGATIILVHHSGKNDKTYDGSNNIKNSLDCLFRAERVKEVDGIAIKLLVEKERAKVKDCAFLIEPSDFSLSKLDSKIASMSEEESDFVDDVKRILEDRRALNKTQLLDSLGFDKTSKKGRAMLNKFDGIFYKSSRKNGKDFTYNLL
jgi:archaellum biogenesis ATPase FlaH